MLDCTIASVDIDGVKVYRRAPSMSHFFFSNDSFFFLHTTKPECDKLKSIFFKYEATSNQAFNYNKSRIFFSDNVDVVKEVDLSSVLRVSNHINSSKYLGLPSMIGRNNSEIFGYLKDILWKRNNLWSSKFLSKASKEVLIKAVAQALLAYCMNVFLLPSNITTGFKDDELLLVGFGFESYCKY